MASCNTNHFHTGFLAVCYSKREQYLASRIKRIMSRSCDLWRMLVNMVKMQCTTSSTSKDARCVNKYSLENDRFIISIYDILRISRERLETEMNTIYFSKVIAVYQFPILQKLLRIMEHKAIELFYRHRELFIVFESLLFISFITEYFFVVLAVLVCVKS